MKRLYVVAISAVSLLGILAIAARAEENTGRAIVASAAGSWSVSTAPGAPFSAGRSGAQIISGGAIKTEEGTVSVVLPGDAKMEVRPHTTVGLPILFKHADESVSQATLVRGAVRVSETGKARRYVEVETPIAIAGVRGTDFEVRYDGKTVQTDVYNDAVALEAHGFGNPDSDIDNDGIPAWLDSDIDGDGSPNTSDPLDADPSVVGATVLGYDAVAINANATIVGEGRTADINAQGITPETKPLENTPEPRTENKDENLGQFVNEIERLDLPETNARDAKEHAKIRAGHGEPKEFTSEAERMMEIKREGAAAAVRKEDMENFPLEDIHQLKRDGEAAKDVTQDTNEPNRKQVDGGER